MKKVLVIVMLIFAFGCSDDATDPSENTIVGEWIGRSIAIISDTGEPMIVRLTLEFLNNGTFKFISEQAEELNYTYTFENNVLIISSVECEGAEGKYTVEFRDNGIELNLLNDECERNKFFVGFFEKYEGPIVSPNPIMNDVRE